MRKVGIFVLFTLSLIFKDAYAWWAAAARGIEPIILSFGAAFAAIGLNDKFSDDLQIFNSKLWSKKEIKDGMAELSNEDKELLIDKMMKEIDKAYEKLTEEEKKQF